MNKKHKFEGTVSKTPETALIEHQKTRKVLNLSEAVERKLEETKKQEIDEKFIKEWDSYEYYGEYECDVCEGTIYSFFLYCPFCGADYAEEYGVETPNDVDMILTHPKEIYEQLSAELEYIDETETYKIAFHPGSYLQDLVEHYGFTKLVSENGLDEAILYDLLKGKQSVTPDIAKRLAKTGLSAETWINLQDNFNKQT